jgi:hypothetical protein
MEEPKTVVLLGFSLSEREFCRSVIEDPDHGWAVMGKPLRVERYFEPEVDLISVLKVNARRLDKHLPKKMKGFNVCDGNGSAEFARHFLELDMALTLSGNPIIYIRDDTWETPPSHFPSVAAYRTYVLNHELGHALGLEHAWAPAGRPANIMHQQTKTLRGSLPCWSAQCALNEAEWEDEKGKWWE